jgi:hypothetical protein
VPDSHLVFVLSRRHLHHEVGIDEAVDCGRRHRRVERRGKHCRPLSGHVTLTSGLHEAIFVLAELPKRVR